MSQKISITVPDNISGLVQISDVYQNYLQSGKPSSYGVDLAFHELNLTKTIKTKDFYLLRSKVEESLRSWSEKYCRHTDKLHKEDRQASVDRMNRDASAAVELVNNLLIHTLDIDDALDWDSLKSCVPFVVDVDFYVEELSSDAFELKLNEVGAPIGINLKHELGRPELIAFKSRYGLFAKLFNKKAIQAAYEEELDLWQCKSQAIKKQNQEREELLLKAKEHYSQKLKEYLEEQSLNNKAVDNLREKYLKGDSSSIEDYCDLVLSTSQYPDYFPSDREVEYRSDNKMLVVNFALPAPSDMPSVSSYKYIKSRDEVSEKLLSEAVKKKMYDSAIYQVAIRTIHELFEADVINEIDSVVFNGLVTSDNPATGAVETKIIASVMASKEEFMAFDLSKVDPKATFKLLKGISAATLVDVTPIPPVANIDKSDKRLIEGRDVIEGMGQSMNLAAMDWQDFEHLIRELFHKEFTVSGGEVKVTQASSDGGVDAIAFDPDPIRGGKIVIQAKRYTNTVGVNAVRDLYGTVMNEGATKGILVTTSDFGPDSYNFAKGKPLSLLNGGNLLSLLEKHGHQARINISEAKQIIA